LDLNADRSGFLVGVGGGVVCDMAGFAASTFMRGIGFGFVASTLLAQVDASVGGKNGVNFSRYKNMAGVFAQPKFVICDTELLKSLPEDELANGFAEIVKHGAMADEAYFRYIEENADAALSLDKAVTDRLVLRSVEIKAAVVSADEREAGDITQQVFINAYRGISKFERKSEFKTWIFRITVNLCRNYFRSNPGKREVQIEERHLSQPETPLTRLLEEEEKERLKSMLDRLPEKQKITLVLRIYQELSYKEIARIVNSAEGTVKANIFHALNRLRSMWQEEE